MYSFILGIIIFVGLALIIAKNEQTSVWLVIGEVALGLIYLFFFAGFLYETLGPDYYEEIDPVDTHYTAFANYHIATLIVFFVFFLVSAALLHIKGKKLPPLAFVLCMVFLIIGIVISGIVIRQVSENIDTEDIFAIYREDSYNVFIMVYPTFNIAIALWLIIKAVFQEADAASTRQYKNKTLNFLNRLLAYGNKQTLWIALLLLPVFALITLILMLFGQEPLSIVKVFTETTTWHFSRQTHPPYLDYNGHYLCTVAACGHPRVVKPLRLGKRHGREIVVNRQLMIANAYEEMLQDYFPKIHKPIRYVYDKYGYPFSRHITTPLRSDLIYFLMKPLECFFLVNLYLFCVNPETKINKQYNIQ